MVTGSSIIEHVDLKACRHDNNADISADRMQSSVKKVGRSTNPR